MHYSSTYRAGHLTVFLLEQKLRKRGQHLFHGLGPAVLVAVEEEFEDRKPSFLKQRKLPERLILGFQREFEICADRIANGGSVAARDARDGECMQQGPPQLQFFSTKTVSILSRKAAVAALTPDHLVDLKGFLADLELTFSGRARK